MLSAFDTYRLSLLQAAEEINNNPEQFNEICEDYGISPDDPELMFILEDQWFDLFFKEKK